MTWSASQKSTIRIADYEEKREDLYYPYNEEIVNQALIKVGNSIGREITRNNLFYNKGRFFNLSSLTPKGDSMMSYYDQLLMSY